jgi:hypothetical protein
MLLSTDPLLEVLAFLSVREIFAGDGLNTVSWLLSTLIAQHHYAIKRLFTRFPITIGGRLAIEVPKFETDCWHAQIVEEEHDWANLYGFYRLSPSLLPLPVVPANQKILGIGNVSLLVPTNSPLYNREV